MANEEGHGVRPGASGELSARETGALLVLIAAGLVCYGASLFVPFHGLDQAWFLDREELHSPLTAAAATDVLPEAPLTRLGLALNAWTAPADPLPLHAVNVLLHLLNALVLYLLILQVGGRRRLEAAFLGALFFLVHPAANPSVCLLAGRAGMQAVFFALLSLTLYVRATEGGREHYAKLGGAAVCYAAAVASHVVALGLPLIFLAADRLRGGRAVLKQRAAVHGVFVGFMFILWRVWTSSEGAAAGKRALAGLDSEWTLGAFSLFVMPWRVQLTSCAPAWSWWGAGLMLGAVLLTGWALYRGHWAGIGGLWCVVALWMPLTGLIPPGALLLSSQTYFPLAGLFVAAGFLLVELPGVRVPRIAGGVLAVLACVLAMVCRIAVPWGDPVALWTQQAEAHPSGAALCWKYAARYALAQHGLEEDSLRKSELIGQAEAMGRRWLDAVPPEGDAAAAFHMGATLEELGRGMRH